jgi:hypothetical protein
MAPEVWADPPIYSKACDIFSFAILANELFTERRPYEGYERLQILMRVQMNQRPNLSDGMQDHGAIDLDLRELITKCWNENRSRRPHFSSVSMLLRQLCQSFGADPRDTIRDAIKAMFTSQPMTPLLPDSSDTTDYSSMGPVVRRLHEEYLRAYDSDDLDRAEALESLRGKACQIVQNLSEATKALNEAKQARRPVHVLRACKAKLEECQRKFEQAAEVHNLMILFQSAQGRNWTNKSNWGTDETLREWYGVTLDEKNRVVKLDLHENQLSGKYPTRVYPVLRALSL